MSYPLNHQDVKAAKIITTRFVKMKAMEKTDDEKWLAEKLGDFINAEANAKITDKFEFLKPLFSVFRRPFFRLNVSSYLAGIIK
jgi:hypothetical protein